MKKKHSSELYASLTAATVETNSADFEILSLRISHRSHAMVQALNVAFQRPALTMFTDGISQHLAQSLLSSVKNEPFIIEEAGNGVQPNSALDILEGGGAIEYENEAIQAIFKMLDEAAGK